jgi:hypothetical protein
MLGPVMLKFNRLCMEFERFEVYVKTGLSAPRLLVGTRPTLMEAQQLAARYPDAPDQFVGIDYIGLYDTGRDEHFWVRVIGTNQWVALDSDAKAYQRKQVALSAN